MQGTNCFRLPRMVSANRVCLPDMEKQRMSVVVPLVRLAAWQWLRETASMVIKRLLWTAVLAAGILGPESAMSAGAVGKTFPTLTVGSTTYSNAVVTDVSGGTLSLRHAGGIASVRLEGIDPKLLNELGIQAPAPDRNKSPARPSNTASTSEGQARVQSPNGAASSQRNPFGEDVAKLDGPMAGVVYGVAAVGVILLILGHILFLVAAFRAGPWWGVGVLFGGFTCGIVPLIFFFTHLEECKKPFVVGVAGFLVFLGLAITVPNYVRAREAAAVKKQAMIPPTCPIRAGAA